MTEHKRKWILPYLLIGAVLTSLTLIFPQIGILEWLTLIPLLIGAYRLCGIETYGLGKTYWYGFLAIFAYYFVIYHWFLYLYPLESVGIDNFSSAFIVAAGWIGLPILQALPGGLIFVLFKLLHRTEVFRRAPLLRPLTFAALWTVFEWSSTLYWTGVPWGRLCLGQVKLLPMLQSASLFGSYFVSFLLVLVNGLLAYAILYRVHPRRSAFCVCMAVLLAGSNFLLGLEMMNFQTPSSETVRVAVLQGNVNSHEKWDETSLSETKAIYADMTRQAAEEGATLIVMPETVFPYSLNRQPEIRQYLSDLARECEVTLIVGALFQDASGDRYNALYQVDPDGTIADTCYFKRHLVPFGEYIPMKDLILTLVPPLGEFSMVMDNNLSAGTDSALLDSTDGTLGALICFDSIYEELSLDSVRDGAELLVLSSNDSWFYDSAAIYQHESQAMLRAIETGRYLVRSGNTGISTVITDRGEHLVWIDALTEGYAVAEAELKTHTTLYVRIGNAFVYACIACYLFLCLLGVAWRVRDTRCNTDR